MRRLVILTALVAVFGVTNGVTNSFAAPKLVPLVTVMNKKTWDSLSPRVQASIDKNSGAVFARSHTHKRESLFMGM